MLITKLDIILLGDYYFAGIFYDGTIVMSMDIRVQ